MAYRTEGELSTLAVQIAAIINNTDIDQRQRLYEKVAMQLYQSAQGHQASLFLEIAKVA
jgi:hypothetical protein